MKTFYLMRVPLTGIPSRPEHFEIITQEDKDFRDANPVAFAGDPGGCLAEIVENMVIPKANWTSGTSLKEIELIKALMNFTGQSAMTCKKALDELRKK